LNFLAINNLNGMGEGLDECDESKDLVADLVPGDLVDDGVTETGGE